jgi:hypothetical protein
MRGAIPRSLMLITDEKLALQATSSAVGVFEDIRGEDCNKNKNKDKSENGEDREKVDELKPIVRITDTGKEILAGEEIKISVSTGFTLKEEEEPMPGFSGNVKVASDIQPVIKLFRCISKPEIKYIETLDAKVK